MKVCPNSVWQKTLITVINCTVKSTGILTVQISFSPCDKWILELWKYKKHLIVNVLVWNVVWSLSTSKGGNRGKDTVGNLKSIESIFRIWKFKDAKYAYEALGYAMLCYSLCPNIYCYQSWSSLANVKKICIIICQSVAW